MKKLYLILAICLVTGALVLFTGCESTTGSEPTNLTITAATDVTVTLTWTVPTAGTPDKYIIYFKAVGQANYTNVAEITSATTTYNHDPSGKTGYYYVTAKFGSNTYNSDTKNTLPVHGATVSLSELNATGNSGYGWSRTDGAAGVYQMTQASSASGVDFYLTNFALGFGATPYNIASPDQGPTDPGGVVPTGSWRQNATSNPVSDPQAALPAHSNTTYFNYTALSAYPSYIGVYTSDGYYALAKLDGLNTTTGTVSVESWFQLVRGLRLIQH